jgi:predicted ATPase
MAASFATARDAVAAAAAFQQALAAEPWHTARPLRARVGLHTDEAVIVDDTGYASLPINRCSRLMTAAHGGQTVLSGATEMLMRGQMPAAMELVDLGQHRLRDLGQPTRIFQLIRDGDREDFPPLRTLDSFPGNLPAQLSSFIGRKTEVSRVASALGESRVVTVTGVGGVGKTRLALQVAADVLPHYRDGVWLVELAPIRDPDGVAQTVASMFNLSNRGGQSLEDSLGEMLAHKELLLVLDNCEHLLAPAARLVTRIERDCPGVSVLATSREGMAVDDEQLIVLPPLNAGEPGGDVTQLVHTDAVSLFVERARRVKANFVLTEDNSRAVVEVCHRLDGVPLAIELAAARVIALSPAELGKRLDRRFQVLAGGRRGAVERHATLRAAIDWSYELLNPAEQRLLARMAAFSGGCALDAIEEICSGDPVEPEAVIDLITALVARSLVVADDHESGTRYRLLETIRQYGEERLVELGQSDTLFTRHARFYADLLARLAERSYGPEQLVCAKSAHLERDNIRAALAYAIDTGDAELAVRLIVDHPARQSHSGAPTGEVLLMPTSRILELAGVRQQPGCPDVLIVAAQKALVGGDKAGADELCRQAVEVEASLGAARRSWRVETHVWVLRAEALTWSGDYAEGVAAYARAADLAVADDNPGLAAMFLAYSVNVALLGGSGVEEVLPIAERAVALARRSSMPGAIVQSLNSLALTLADDSHGLHGGRSTEGVGAHARAGRPFDVSGPLDQWCGASRNQPCRVRPSVRRGQAGGVRSSSGRVVCGLWASGHRGRRNPPKRQLGFRSQRQFRSQGTARSRRDRRRRARP